jgi:Rieske Fe-S protein
MAGVVAVLASCAAHASNRADSSDGPVRSNGPPSTANAPSSIAAEQELASASEIPVGGGKVFDKQQVVVTQPISGQFKAFSAICPHRGCTVSTVNDGVIECPCHRSLFSISDGSVKSGPASEPLSPRTIALRGQDLYLQ